MNRTYHELSIENHHLARNQNTAKKPWQPEAEIQPQAFERISPARFTSFHLTLEYFTSS